jgi:hypothetical protein
MGLQIVCTCTINITRLTSILDLLVWRKNVIVMVNNIVYVLYPHIQGKWSLTKYKTSSYLARFCKFKFGHESNWTITLIGFRHVTPAHLEAFRAFRTESLNYTPNKARVTTYQKTQIGYKSELTMLFQKSTLKEMKIEIAKCPEDKTSTCILRNSGFLCAQQTNQLEQAHNLLPPSHQKWPTLLQCKSSKALHRF